VEVKSVTHVEGDAALFPDAVTQRGLKHLRELGAVVREGGRAVLLFVVQRPDGRLVAPAAHIDPDYAEGLGEAEADGVELLAYRAEATPERLAWAEAMPVRVDHENAGGEASARGG
jgi:sugar fermentation stimulation protein A